MVPGCFTYKRGILHIGGISYVSLVAKYGTPLVCVSLERIEQNILAVTSILKKYYPYYRLHYAVKASYLKPVLETVKNMAIGIEVISPLEIEIAQSAGFTPQRIMFNGVGRTGRDLYNAIRAGIATNIDSYSELEKLIKAKTRNERLSVGIRVHPEYDGDGNFIQRGSKLGMSYKDAIKCVLIAKKHQIFINGLHFHVFSNKTESKDYVKAITSVLTFATEIEKRFKIDIEYVDIGGGFSPPMFFTNTKSLESFFIDLVKPFKEEKKKRTIIFEPGRYVVSDAVAIFSKISTIKRTDENIWAILDIGTNYLIPASGYQFRVIPCIKKRIKMDKTVLISYADGICSPAGMIDAAVHAMPREGDHVVVLNSGAYTSVMKEEFVFPSPAHVFIKRSQVTSIIPRAGINDVLKYHGWH